MLQVFCQEIQEQIQNSFSTFRVQTKCIIPEQKLSLLARLFVIEHSIKSFSPNFVTQPSTLPRTPYSIFKTPSTKRRRTKRNSMLIDELLSSTTIAHFQIILTILQKWSHRLNEEIVELIAQTFIKININKE